MEKTRALVIIDMQKGFINDKTAHLPNLILDYANTHHFDHILGTAYINNENTACYIFEKWYKCMEGSEEAEIVPELKPIIGKVFNKGKYSCWNEEFRQYVQDNNIDELYFVGISTACCVLHSAFDAYDDLQECYVISDLCGSMRGESSHQPALQLLRECITEDRVITSTTPIN